MRPAAGVPVVLALLAFGSAGDARAARLNLPDGKYAYTVLNEDLRNAIRHFCDDVHIRVSISDSLKGRIRGRMSAASPRAFIDLVTSMYGLDWYYDGYTLYVTQSDEGVTRMIDLSNEDGVTLQKALDASDVSDPRYPLRLVPGTHRILVSGPPRYVDLVAQTASALVPPQPAQASPGDGAQQDTTTVIRGAATQKLSFPR